MCILIVEDDFVIVVVIIVLLCQGGYVVDYVISGVQVDIVLCDGLYDLLVFDLGLLVLDGSEVLYCLCQCGFGVLVLVIIVCEGLNECVCVFDLGVDDYLVKLFVLVEFEVCVWVLLCCFVSKGVIELCIGCLWLDVFGYCVWVDEQLLEFIVCEFGLFEVLVSCLDCIINCVQLVEVLCNWDQEFIDNGLDIVIYCLCCKLYGSGVNVCIVCGLGYLLEESVDV